MSIITINCKKRDTNLKSKDLLSKFRLPAVMYWANNPSVPLEVDYQEFRNAIKIAWQWQIIKLNFEWKDHNVLIKSYDLDLVKHTFTHVDFYIVDMDKKVHAKIPIELYWKSEAVKLWWILSQKLDTIEIICKPKDLPKCYKVNIEKLTDGSSHIVAGDLEWIENAEVTINLDAIVASIIVPRTITETTTKDEEKEEDEAVDTAKEWESEWKESKA